MRPETDGSPSATQRIRTQLERVAHLRERAHTAGSALAVREVKQLQAQRFRATYADFLSDPRHAPATRFFLEELYAEHDFSARDAQFGRIAGALERLFPAAVTDLAVDLAETHAATESLDHELAGHWLHDPVTSNPALRYVHCWRRTGDRAQRQRQLEVVLHMGRELQRLTRQRTLLTALKWMRGPAHAAGLGALQNFLEDGFSAFATMGDAGPFLQAIAQREQHWIDILFDADLSVAQASLQQEWQRARG